MDRVLTSQLMEDVLPHHRAQKVTFITEAMEQSEDI